jgi:outer membrane immunogenic protein
MKATLLAAAAFSLMTASAFAADLGVPFAAPAHFTWTGCYAGGNVGGGWGQKDLTDTTGFLAGLNGGVGGPGSASDNISGYMLGGQIGCDYQFLSDWVLGVEGYAVGGKIRGNTAFTAPAGPGTYTATTNFLTAGTARLGYAWGRWLPYVKGGAAWAGDSYSVIDAAGAYDAEATEDRLGWTAGAGIEWALWNDWSVKLEYDYYGFGSRNVTFTDNVSSITGPVEVKQDIQVIKLGLNFHVFAGQDLAP